MAEQPSDEDIRKWHRRFAIDANNRAWALIELAQRSPADDAEMLNIAHASAWHWSKVGTAHNAALADMLLAQVHALLGDGPNATRYADATFAYFGTRESEPWEMAFTHAVTAHAAHAAGDHGRHRQHYATARDLGNALANAEERAIFDATFRTVPAPGAGTQSR